MHIRRYLLLAMVSRDYQFQVALIEHDVNEDNLCVWTYPSISQPIQSLLEKRPFPDTQSTIYLKYKTEWIYVIQARFPKEEVLPEVLGASISIVSKVFNPEKYFVVLKLFLHEYIESRGDPTKILDAYLNIYTTGGFKNKIGSIDMSSFDDNLALTSVSIIKEIVEDFGVEVVILWNAVLLKKRILVYDDNVEKLLSFTRSLPQFSIHRKDWSIVRPIVTSASEHLDDLSSCGVFIAGTSDSILLSQSDLYDVIVSVPEHRITVSSHAAASLKLCSIHREVASVITEAAAAGTSQTIIAATAKKTVTIISQLKSLVDSNGKVTEAAINASVANEAAQQWLHRLATAEGYL